ncbi:hypothetical protein FMK36_24945 [Klebsiella quasipneumoniae]|nr:hypothetical protein [Klebsiella quasipneumoniae]
MKKNQKRYAKVTFKKAGSLCFCAKAVGHGSLVTFYMSEWLAGCYNTHQPPIFTAGNLRYWRRL